MMLKYRKLLLCACLLSILSTSYAVTFNHSAQFVGIVSKPSPSILTKIKKYTWHPNCPIALSDLRIVSVSYHGFDNSNHIGAIVVNKSIAPNIVNVFKGLFNAGFPLKKVEPLYQYKGDELAAFKANNSFAFHCSKKPGETNIATSKGLAININPLQNPYVIDKDLVIPKSAKKNASRLTPAPGKITVDSKAYKIFTRHGWLWSGDNDTIKDYMEFQKAEQRS